MTNKIAFFLGLFILCALAVDYSIYGSEHFIFLGKKFLELLEWVKFWR